jgi:hypothetical protein
VRLPGPAYRHGAADVFQAGQRGGALERTRFRTQQLGFEAPEQILKQILKLLQPAVTQLGSSSSFSPVCRETPTIKAFPAAPGHHR